MRHSAVLSYALHSEYDADTQRDEEQNISLPNITLYSGPLLVNTSMCHLKSERPPPHRSQRGKVYVRHTIVSPNIVSIVTQVLNPPEPSSAKFRWGRAHLGGLWCDISNFSQNFLAYFFSAANFWSCKGVPHNGEMQKRAKLHIVNFEKEIDIILLTSASKKEQTSGEVSPLPEIATGRKGNLTWH